MKTANRQMHPVLKRFWRQISHSTDAGLEEKPYMPVLDRSLHCHFVTEQSCLAKFTGESKIKSRCQPRLRLQARAVCAVPSRLLRPSDLRISDFATHRMAFAERLHRRAN